MTEAQSSMGLSRLSEYPGLLIPLTPEELQGWTAIMDMAGKKRSGKYHAPMEWMVHASLVRTNGAAIINAGEQYLGNAHHLLRMGDFFFNVPDSIFRVERNPHIMLIVEEFFNNKFLSLLGSACVRGDTRILNPITGESPTIKELHERGEGPMVMTLKGPQRATVPFIKGHEMLYEVTFEDGLKFFSTAAHRVLSSSGTFYPLAELKVGDELLGYTASCDPPQSTSDNDPSNQPRGALRSLKIAEDYLDGCSVYPHPCGEPPPFESGNDRSFSPSRDGVQGCSECAFVRMDDHGKEFPDNRPCLCSTHPSTQRSQNQRMPLGIHGQSRGVEEMPERARQSFQPLFPSQQENNPPSPCEGSSHCSLDTQTGTFSPSSLSESRFDSVCDGRFEQRGQSDQRSLSHPEFRSDTSQQSFCFDPDSFAISYNYTVSPKKVVSICKTKEDDFYDLTVPGAGHYFAEGCIHHNSAGKSYSMAIIGLLMFLVNPRNTKILVTCTTIQAGRGKIWGDMSNGWNQIEAIFKSWGLMPPGKLMSEPTMVRYQCPVFDPARGWVVSYTSHKAGMELIATLQSSEKQAVASVQGYKNDTVIFLGDEWDSFSPALADTVTGNLAANPNARCVASLNISGRNSAGGLICTPEGGWDTVDPSMDRWMGVHGLVLRFDATKSPNVLLGYEKWKGLPTKEYVEHETEKYGEDSIGYWMYVRAWPPPTGEARFIYSEMELTTQYLCDHKVTTWLQPPTRIAACDPSFVMGGDGAMLFVLNVGPAQVNGKTVILCEVHRAIDLDKFITLNDVTKDKQVVLLLKRFMSDPEVGFEIKNLAVDVTGATSFGTLINELVGTGWIPIVSGAKPSDRIVSKADTRKGTEVFENLMSEMWLAPKALVRSGQIKGLDIETIREMCMRCFGKSDRGKDLVESKKIMKKRNKKLSPNRADAFFIGVHVARLNHGLVSTTHQGGLKKHQAPQSAMQKFYEENPALKPKVPKWRRPAFQNLKGTHRPW